MSHLARNCLCPSSRIIHCASPAYIKNHGQPKDTNSLTGQHLVHHEPPAWLGIKRDPLIDQIESRFYTNEVLAARRAEIGGVGIAFLPEVQISNFLKNDEPAEVLPELAISIPVNLFFPCNKKFTTKLRAFIDHMVSFS